MIEKGCVVKFQPACLNGFEGVIIAAVPPAKAPKPTNRVQDDNNDACGFHNKLVI